MLDRFFVAGFGEGQFMVYQLLDREGAPLYIGQTQHLERRLKEHEATKPWFGEVASIWFEYANHRGSYRHGVYDLERKRIEQLSPRYNRKSGRRTFPDATLKNQSEAEPIAAAV